MPMDPLFSQLQTQLYQKPLQEKPQASCHAHTMKLNEASQDSKLFKKAFKKKVCQTPEHPSKLMIPRETL